MTPLGSWQFPLGRPRPTALPVYRCMTSASKPLALTISEAAAATRLSERTICRAIKEGTLTCARVGRGSVRIMPADLEQWLADHRQGRLATFERHQAKTTEQS